MRNFTKHALLGVLIAGGITLLGATVANAAETDGDDGLLSGTQVLAVVEAPVSAVGNALSVVGDAVSQPAAPAPAPAAEAPAAPSAPTTTSGEDSVGGGTQAVVDAAVPVAVTGNAISVVGDSDTSSDAPQPAPAAPADSDGSEAVTSGQDGILGGTQAVIDAVIPVTVTDNAISVLGDSESTSSGSAPAATADRMSTDAATSGDDGILGGTQVLPSVSVPVTVTGNAISVLGDSSSEDGDSTTGATGNTGTTGDTSGDDGILGGTQVAPTVALPVTIGGNAVSVVGDSSTTTPGTPADPDDPVDPSEPTAPVGPTDPETPATPGTDGSVGTADTVTIVGQPAAVGTAIPLALAETGGTGLSVGLLVAATIALAGGGLLVARRRTV